MSTPPVREIEHDRAGHHLERRPDGAGDGLDQRGLAAARFAGQAVDLVAPRREGRRRRPRAPRAGCRTPRSGSRRAGRETSSGAGAVIRSRGHPSPPSGETAARVDVLVHRDRQQEQADEVRIDQQHREDDPPPDAGDQGGMLVRPVDHAADGRRVDVGEAQHRQRDLEADRPVDVVHGGREHDRQHEGQVLLRPGSRRMLMPEKTPVSVNSRVRRLIATERIRRAS